MKTKFFLTAFTATIAIGAMWVVKFMKDVFDAVPPEMAYAFDDLLRTKRFSPGVPAWLRSCFV